MEIAELDLIDEDIVERIDAMPAEQRSQYLDALKEEVDVRIATQERIDGEETCDGDPETVIEALALRQGI